MCLRRLPVYAFTTLFLLNSFIGIGNYDGENGIGVVEEKIEIVQQAPELSYRERLDKQVSRGEVRSLIVEATAYDLSYESCGKYPGDPAYGITASGEYAREGFIAVDPDVIPMNSRCYIEGRGIVVAKDTGGAIVGNTIDIFIPDRKEALKFGRRNLKIYILGKE